MGRQDSDVGHEFQDRVGLEMGRQVANLLREDPGVLEVARRNLESWSHRNAGSPALMAAYAEWREILEEPVEDICGVLSADTEEGRRLRQNSPFAGVLSPQEVWLIKKRNLWLLRPWCGAGNGCVTWGLAGSVGADLQ